MDIIDKKAKALENLRPGAAWTMHDDVIEWLDVNQKAPSDEELNSEILKIEAEYQSKSYARNRAKEYPSFFDYIDGVVKNDQEQINKYISDCLLVKAKYPKHI